MNKKFFSVTIQAFISILMITGIIYLQMPLLKSHNNALTKEQALRETQQNKVLLKFLKITPSLGFDNLIADWTFLKFIQYFGDAKAREYTDYSLNPDYFQVVVDKDPRFVTAYFLLNPATTIFSGRPDLSVKLLSQGLEYISPQQPQAYQVWFYKGIDELLFLGKPSSAEKSYRIAYEWSKYSDNPFSLNAGQRALEIANFLAENPDSTKAQASAWMSIFINANDAKTQQLALEKIKQLGGKLNIKNGRLILSFPEQN